MIKAASLLLAALLAAPAVATELYAVDSRHTFPMFEINHLGFSTQRGRFDKTSGKIVIDRDAKKGHVELTIDAASIDMGFEDWNKHMRGADYFNTDSFPTITFKSDNLSFDGDAVTGADGELTILGVTRPVTLKVTAFKCGADMITRKPRCGADVVAQIKRSDFGMSRYVPYIGDDVRLMIPLEAIQQ